MDATSLSPHRLAIVAIGSNLGDSRDIVYSAMDRLQTLSDVPLLRSSLWETEPIDCPPECGWFVNAVVGLLPHARLTPETLLEYLQAWENECGRLPKKVLNEPRPLDLDLVAFGRETRSTPRLVLPHPRARQRRFVLAPLAEILPDLILPGEFRTVAECLRALASPEVVRRIPEEGSAV